MMTEDQSAVIAFLADPSTHAVETIERIETHASIVFLAGPRAYKLKRAVRFDYLDFSTAERRRACCEAELRLNRRTAPALYRGLVAITREDDGGYALHGHGAAVEWLVEMARFPQEMLLDRLAAAGRLDLALMAPLGSAIAAFHAGAEPRPDHGGRAGMSWVIEGNASGLAEFGRDLDQAAASRVFDESRVELARRGALLEQRRAAGLVRQCHGDLHLRNIVLLDGRPTPFDGVEFNDAIACTDVLYDLAFLLMDLVRRRLPRHANAVWNRYLADTGDFDGVALLPLFLSCRAAVRAKTGATAASLAADPRRREDLLAAAREYLAMAGRLLHPPPPTLVAIGGLSGSGKSTLALGLAPSIGGAPGAVVLRSDETRKRLAGVTPFERLGPDGYSGEMSARVYATLAAQAAQVLRGGHSVVVDAVHAGEAERQAIEGVAAAAGAPFVGVWLDAPEPALVARTDARRDDASDADARVVRQQHARGTGLVRWRRIDAAQPAETVASNASAIVHAALAEPAR